jgi:putative salt-induced outer membrane protein YdiY
MKRGMLIAFVGCFLFLATSSVSADQVFMKNGDQITGEIKHMTNGKLLFKPKYAKLMEIDWKEVVGLKTEKILPVHLKDKTSVVGKLEVIEEKGKIRATTATLEEAGTFKVDDVVSINPPPPPPFLKVKGSVSANASIYRGNTKTREAGVRAELVTRTERQRLTLRAGWDYADTDDTMTKRAAFGSMKFDFFITKKFYAYAHALFMGDKFADLTLRTSLGAGVGYQWIDTDTTDFYTEAGISYFDEDYRRAEDKSTVTARFSWKLDHWIVPKHLSIFHFMEAYPGLEDEEDIYIHTEQGIRAAFWGGFFATAQINWDYDNTPAKGRKRQDVAYLFGLGYNFSNY